MQREAVWIPAWYELDQTVIVGDRDEFRFIVRDDEWQFWTSLAGDVHEAVAARATIRAIRHSQFGELRAIRAEGLDYTLITTDGEQIVIEAEETPGFVYKIETYLKDRRFIVTLDDVELVDR